MRGFCYFLLSILTQVDSSSLDVIGLVGHNVTLPCSYDAQAHGLLSFCWGRGKVPRFKCFDPILSSMGGAVRSRQSSKYQLLGNMADGDVSLTIVQAEVSDAGVYGCRVEIPGWFNDYKVNVHLSMEEEPTEQPVSVDEMLPTAALEMLTTSSFSAEGSKSMTTVSTEEYFNFKAFLGVGNLSRMAAIFLLSIIIIIILAFFSRRRLLLRIKLQRLHSSAPENIYETIPMY